jgi:teichuronic acid exporter
VDGTVTAGRKKKKSYGQAAKKGAAWSVVRQGGHELMGVPFSMVMARLLTPTEFGVAVAASFFVLLAARLTQFGFSAALVRIKEVREEHTSSVFVASMVMGLGSYLILALSAPAIGRFFESPDSGALVRVSALAFLISPFSSVANALITREMRFRALALADWTDTLVGASVTITLALFGWSYWSIVYGNVTATLARVTLQMYLSGWWPSLRFSRAALRELLSYGLGVQTKRLLEYAAANLDTLVVGRMLDMTSLGFYDKAFSTMNRLVNRLTFGQAPFRIFSIIHDDPERFRRAYTRLILSVTMLGFPVLAACIVVASPLFEVLYGKQWQVAVLPFQVLCFGGMLKLLNNYAAQANEAVGNVWLQAARQGFGTVLVVIGAVVGSLAWGIAGAAIGVTVAMAILTVTMQELVRRAVRLSWIEMMRPLVPALVCTALMVGVLYPTLRVMIPAVVPKAPAILQLAILGVVGSVAYVIFVLFSPFIVLRELVVESIDDLLPSSISRRFRWLGAGQSSGAH